VVETPGLATTISTRLGRDETRSTCTWWAALSVGLSADISVSPKVWREQKQYDTDL
jgi:hypothetical protein